MLGFTLSYNYKVSSQYQVFKSVLLKTYLQCQQRTIYSCQIDAGQWLLLLRRLVDFFPLPQVHLDTEMAAFHDRDNRKRYRLPHFMQEEPDKSLLLEEEESPEIKRTWGLVSILLLAAPVAMGKFLCRKSYPRSNWIQNLRSSST